MNRSVKININVGGNFADNLKSLKNAFNRLDHTAKTITKSLNDFKVPRGFGTAIKHIKSLDNVKLPDIKNLADGVAKLKSFRQPPKLEKLIDELNKLEKIDTTFFWRFSGGMNAFNHALDGVPKRAQNIQELFNILRPFSSGSFQFPDFRGLAQGMRAVAGEDVNMRKFSARLRSLAVILDKLAGKEYKLPDTRGFADGIIRLSNTFTKLEGVGAGLQSVSLFLHNIAKLKFDNVGAFAIQLSQLTKVSDESTKLNNIANALHRFTGKKLKLPDVESFTKGLADLKRLKIESLPNKFEKLAASLVAFQGIRVPNMLGFANGLKTIQTINPTDMYHKLKALADELARFTKIDKFQGLVNFASDLRVLISATTKASPAIKATEKAVNSLTKRMKSSSAILKEFTDKFRRYSQYRLVSDSINGMKEAMMKSFQVLKDYDQSLHDLQAITGATSQEVSFMGEKIKEVASDTKFSASEVADAMKTLGQAGFSATEAIQTMPAVADLATGTLSNMSTTVDLVTTAMRVFHIEASRSSEVVDVFANAINKSKLTVDKLRISMNYVAPIAYDAGVSFSEMATAMATLANSGQRASTIGTGLRRVFAELVDPSEKFSEAARNAGISLDQLDPRVHSFNDVLGSLKYVVNDSRIAFELFGKRGASAILSLVNNQDDFGGLLMKIQESGAASRMAGIQVEGLGIKFKNLTDKLEVLAITIGEAGITDLLHGIVDVAKGLVVILTELAKTALGKTVIKLTAAFTALGLAVGALIVGRYAMTSLILRGKQMARTFKVLARWAGISSKTIRGVGMAINTYLPVIGLATAAIALLVHAYESLGRVRQEAADAAKEVSAYNELNDTVLNYAESVHGLSENTDEYKEANKKLRTSLQETATTMKEVATEAHAVVLAINPITGVMNDNGEALDEYQKKVNEIKFDSLVEGANKAVDTLYAGSSELYRIVDNLTAKFDQLLAVSGSGFKVWSALINFEVRKIPGILKDTWGEVRTIADNYGKAANFSGLYRAGKKSFQDLEEFVKSVDYSKPISDQTQRIIDSYNLISENAEKSLAEINKLGVIDMAMTDAQLMKVFNSLGYATDTTEVLLHKMRQMEEMSKSGDRTLAHRWARDWEDSERSLGEYTDAFANSSGEIAEYYNKLSESEKSSVSDLEKRRYELAKQAKLIDETFQKEINDGKDLETARRNRIASEKELHEKINLFNEDSYNNQHYYVLRTIQDTELALDKEIKALETKLGKTEEFERKRADAYVKAQARMHAAKTLRADPAEMERRFTTDSAQKGTDFEGANSALALQYAQELITEKEYQTQREGLIITRYENELNLAEEYYEKLKEAGNLVDEKQLAKAHKAKLDAEANLEKAVAKITIDITKRKQKEIKEEHRKRVLDQQNTNKLALANIKTWLEEELFEIQLAETKKEITKEKAEASRLRITQEYNRQVEEAHKAHIEALAGMGVKQDDQSYQTALKAEQQAKAKGIRDERKQRLANVKFLQDQDKKAKKAELDRIESKYSEQLRLAEESHKKILHIHRVHEALGTWTTEQANLETIKADERFYAEQVEKYKQYENEVYMSGTASEDQLRAVQEKLSEARVQQYENAQRALLAYAKEINRVNQQLKESQDKIDDENAKHTDNRTKNDNKYAKHKARIESELNEKILKYRVALNDKLKKLNDDRIDNEQETINDIKSIERKASEDIRAVENRGKSQKQIDRSNRKAYKRMMSDGLDAIDTAKSVEDIKEAQKLLNDAYSLAKDFDSDKKAKDGIRNASNALIQAREKERVLKDADIAKDEQRAIELEARKAAAAQQAAIAEQKKYKDLYKEWNTAEQTRHDNRMSNLQDEYDKFAEQLEIAEDLKNALLETPTSKDVADAIKKEQEKKDGTKKKEEAGKDYVKKEDGSYSNVDEFGNKLDIQKDKDGVYSAGEKGKQDIKKDKDGVYRAVQEEAKELETQVVDTKLNVVDESGKSTEKVVDNIKQNLTDVSEAEHKITVTQEGAEEIVATGEAFKAIETKEVEVSAETKGEKEVSALAEAVNGLVDKTMKIIVDAAEAIATSTKLLDLVKAIEDKDGTTVNIKIKETVERVTGGANTSQEGTETAQGFNTGGSVFRRLANRYIDKGKGFGDDVPAMLMRGEFVHKTAAVRKYGRSFMEKINNLSIPAEAVQNFNTGGLVGFANSISSFSAPSMTAFKRKLDQLMGFKDTKVEIDATPINNAISKASKDISSSVGQQSVSNLSSIAQNGVLHLSTGGDVSSILKELFKEQNRSTTQFGKLIQDANPQDVQAIQAEQKKVRILNETLQTTLSQMQKEYMDYIAKRSKQYEQDVEEQKAKAVEAAKEARKQYMDDLKNDRSSYKEARAKYSDAMDAASSDFDEAMSDPEKRFKNAQKNRSGAISAAFRNSRLFRGVRSGRGGVETTNRNQAIKNANVSFGFATKKYEEALKEPMAVKLEAEQQAKSEWQEYKREQRESIYARRKTYEDAKESARKETAEALLELEKGFKDDLWEAKNKLDENTADSYRQFKEMSAELKIDRNKELDQGSQKKNTLTQVNVLKSATDKLNEASTRTAESVDELIKKMFGGLPGYNTGGYVKPTNSSVPGKDSILSWLTPKEYVIKEPVVRAFGTDFFDSINNFKIPGFNLGGIVGGDSVKSSLLTKTPSVNKTALALTINDNNIGTLEGSKQTVDSFINELSLAQMRV